MRIRRLQLTYQGLALSAEAAQTLSRRLLRDLSRRLPGDIRAGGVPPHVWVPTIKVRADRIVPDEVVERVARALVHPLAAAGQKEQAP